MIQTQEQNAKGIGSLLFALNKMLQEEKEDIPKKEYISIISDTIRHYSALQNQLSMQRRAMLNNSLNKTVVELAATTPIDKFLYGENFGDKLKAAKAAEKSAKDISLPKKSLVNVKQHLNSYGPTRKGDPRQYQGRNSQQGARPRYYHSSYRQFNQNVYPKKKQNPGNDQRRNK